MEKSYYIVEIPSNMMFMHYFLGRMDCFEGGRVCIYSATCAIVRQTGGSLEDFYRSIAADSKYRLTKEEICEDFQWAWDCGFAREVVKVKKQKGG